LGFSKLSKTGRYTAIGTWGASCAHLMPLCAVSERERPCEEASENQIVPLEKTEGIKGSNTFDPNIMTWNRE